MKSRSHNYNTVTTSRNTSTTSCCTFEQQWNWYHLNTTVIYSCRKTIIIWSYWRFNFCSRISLQPLKIQNKKRERKNRDGWNFNRWNLILTQCYLFIISTSEGWLVGCLMSHSKQLIFPLKLQIITITRMLSSGGDTSQGNIEYWCLFFTWFILSFQNDTLQNDDMCTKFSKRFCIWTAILIWTSAI